jgi:hypothetical protein
MWGQDVVPYKVPETVAAGQKVTLDWYWSKFIWRISNQMLTANIKALRDGLHNSI